MTPPQAKALRHRAMTRSSCAGVVGGAFLVGAIAVLIGWKWARTASWLQPVIATMGVVVLVLARSLPRS